jgi:dienelactone hydrolase
MTRSCNQMIFAFFLIIGSVIDAQAQKPAIDSSVFQKWPELHAGISDNGNYFYYNVFDKIKKTNQITVGSNYSGWKIDLENVSDFHFSPHSKYAFFINRGDSLGYVKLGNSTVFYTPAVVSFKCFESHGNEFLTYLSKSSEAKLTIIHFLSGKKKVFTNVVGYVCQFDNKKLLIETKSNGTLTKLISYDLHTGKEIIINSLIKYYVDEKANMLLAETASTISQPKNHILEWINMETGSVTQIWEGIGPYKIMFSKNGLGIAFVAKGKDGMLGNSVYYFVSGMKNASELSREQLPPNNKSDDITDVTFNSDGSNIFTHFSHPSPLKKQNIPTFKGSPNIVVWHYKDRLLQSEQSRTSSINDGQLDSWVAIDLKRKNHIASITHSGESLLGPTYDFKDYAITRKDSTITDTGRYYTYLYRVSIENGERQLITHDKAEIDNISLSPQAKFLTWYDPDSLAYFSYEISANLTRKISTPTPVYDVKALKSGRNVPFGFAGWTVGDESMFIYDQYDIWKIDPRQQRQSVCITNNYGRDHLISFAILNTNYSIINDKAELLLGAYDNYTKDNGFYKLKPGAKLNKDMGKMSPYCYWVARTGRAGGAIEIAKGMFPLKAKNADAYLVQRNAASDFPNFYFTKDFFQFRPITDIHPQKKYNWLNVELIHWMLPDGNIQQGLLYKPENFDPAQKYSLIFNYYEKCSDTMHKFLFPDYSSSDIDIAYYVSNGYLVFVPDIDFIQKQNGVSVLNTIVSAAHYLSRLAWVDSARLGLQGHSLGGWETNFIIAHSNLFAAACEAAGFSDEVSDYGQIYSFGMGEAGQYVFEGSAIGANFGMGNTPWTRPDLYIANSPIFFANKVLTPLLISHGNADGNVPFAQGIEMYLALRRAGKKVWLLEYNNAHHSLRCEDAKDYTIRMKQFFDHYLKGAPSPKWMTRGVPYAKRQTDSGLDADTSGCEP